MKVISATSVWKPGGQRSQERLPSLSHTKLNDPSMNSLKKLFLVAVAAVLSLGATLDTRAGGGDHYASFWNCSDGNTYGLVAQGNRRALYLPTGRAPLFFSGVKQGCYYYGTIYLCGREIPVSGPITRNSTRVTLWAHDGRHWVLDFSHR